MKFVLKQIVSFADMMMAALAVMCCWNWMVAVSWHVPPITFGMAFAAEYTLSTITAGSFAVVLGNTNSKHSDAIPDWAVSSIMALVVYPIAIGVSWIARHFLV